MPVINALGRMTPRKSSNNPRNGKAGLAACRIQQLTCLKEPVPISSNSAQQSLSPSPRSMRRSFRTRRLLVFDTRGFTPGWYTVPRWGTQSQLTFSTEPVPIYNFLRTCPYLRKPWTHGPSPCFRCSPKGATHTSPGCNPGAPLGLSEPVPISSSPPLPTGPRRSTFTPSRPCFAFSSSGF